METNGTKSPRNEHGKPGRMVLWNANLLIYELVVMALKGKSMLDAHPSKLLALLMV